MNLENALRIEGAMDLPELQWLAEQASKHNRIVEVGSWQGRSTRVLADNTEGTVIAVDHWKGSEEHQDFLKTKSPKWLWEEFLKNISGLPNVAFMFMSSVEAARNFLGENPDMIFIDASHDYENVKADIEAWKPLLKPKGLLCGHDAGYPPVARAVSELIPGASIAGCIWYKEL